MAGGPPDAHLDRLGHRLGRRPGPPVLARDARAVRRAVDAAGERRPTGLASGLASGLTKGLTSASALIAFILFLAFVARSLTQGLKAVARRVVAIEEHVSNLEDELAKYG